MFHIFFLEETYFALVVENLKNVIYSQWEIISS